MAPTKWDDEEDESSEESSPVVPTARRGKFDDEEDDSDVLESWDKAEDSEVEREKEKAAAEAKAKAEALAQANKKPKSQRIEERRVENMRRKQEAEEAFDTSDEEDEAARRARLRQAEKDADLKNAEDLFGSVGISNNRSASRAVTLTDPSDPSKTIELSSLKLFDPQSVSDFVKLRDTLVPLLNGNSKKPQYATTFLPEFVKQISKDLSSDQIKKVISLLTALSNEKMKEEKAAEKGGKKTKAAKTKTTLNASRETALRADTNAYDDDGLDDGDFM